ncbi:CLUMA_CG006771, isoform A [Clunio marinus]|uniref:CLUMA_CG006771, isoform A n=1 Tax=Clunio marinus TaxID=568069 RepID=A0A1J1HZ43_9DIPT|nr:CLUMA_CG006771, isoform A [Clunio marinus]
MRVISYSKFRDKIPILISRLSRSLWCTMHQDESSWHAVEDGDKTLSEGNARTTKIFSSV